MHGSEAQHYAAERNSDIFTVCFVPTGACLKYRCALFVIAAQGDVLSGCIAAFAAWARQAEADAAAAGAATAPTSSANAEGPWLPTLMLAAYAGCLATR